MFSFYERIEE
jgi:hypothetical protein